MSKILVVGAGFSGAVVARQCANFGHSVTIIEKRNHVGGNCFDYINDIGILVHKYGPHLFHTSKTKVVQWLSEFTEWVDYKHKVKAMLSNGQLVTFPVNAETARLVGKNRILDIFFKPYTKKMWGLEIEELDPSVIQRVPIRNDNNDLYFPDETFQIMPKFGYFQLFKSILKHKNIRLLLNTAWSNEMLSEYDFIFNSMPIDEFFNYSKGRLPYRSIKFHTYTIPIPRLFPVATVNFTHEGPYTRVTEWKNITNNNESKNLNWATTITVEEPCSDFENNYERFYPVKDITGINVKKYQNYIASIPKKMTFIGRCGMYKYLNMDEAIELALNISKEVLEKGFGQR